MEAEEKRGTVVACVALATLMNGLDTTIISTAKPRIEGDLQDVLLSAWMFTAFTAAAAASGPAWGRLSDFLGRKRLLIAALVGFTAASVACGLAPTMLALVLFRAAQGLFGGGLYPLANAVVADLYPPEERSRGIALLNSINAIAFAIGPVLGAFLAKFAGWRWCFFVNVPILAAAVVLISTHYRERRESRAPEKFDYGGMAAFGLAVGLFVVGLGFGKGDAAWSSPLVLGLLAGSAAAAVIFVFIERAASRPFLPLGFLTRGSFGATAACLILNFAAFISILAFVPGYLRGARGAADMTLGLLVLCVVIGWFTTAALSGKLVPKIGARLLALFGMLITAGGVALLNLWTLEFPTWGVVATLLVLGGGMGWTSPPLYVLGQTTLPPTEQGLASGLLGVSNNLGSTIGTAIFGSILAASVTAHGITAQAPQLMNEDNRDASVAAIYGDCLHSVFQTEFVPVVLMGILLAVGLAVWGRGKPASSPARE